ncbi:DUF2235 domain-containing protein [Methylocystis sp. SC2]|uniref:DUF2235 domain-containing protein n=1 Tax=Methylocystis sp. (strain SC2) TaxID=187303 RepID=UPI00027AEA7A|nr:DUF2235 domain-containing protein [Methylocystis sp. SC2]CCJ06209.1 Putative peptidoglycan binding domain protein [Methylocystis sp. SC2]
MFKTIVLFSDGTGNSSSSPFKTNVFRLYAALDMTPDKGQIAYYDDGVGSSQHRWLAAITGAFGFGLKRNVLDLYKFLTRHYRDAMQTLDLPPSETSGGQLYPPKIACFGFSRGAFTIRVLIGLVASEGLPLKADSEAELNRLAERAYQQFRARNFHTVLGVENVWRWFRDKLVIPFLDRNEDRYDRDKNRQVDAIDFLGLWDTVGAYGMPVEELRVFIDKFIFPLTFSSYDLLPIVRVTRHALSIDDERDAFTPIPFDDADVRHEAARQRSEIIDKLVESGMSREEAEEKAHQDVCERSQQIWFAGVHANVGGGYPDDSQAILPLRWIMIEAEKQGVVFLDVFRKDVVAKATAFGQSYDSRSGLNALYRYKPRDIPEILKQARQLTLRKRQKGSAAIAAVPAPRPLIHESVIYRMALRFEGYAPIALPQQFDVVDNTGRPKAFIDFTADAGARQGRFANGEHAGTRARMAGLAELVDRLKPPTQEALDLVKCAVFWRRVSYQVTLWSLILLLLMPLLERREPDLSDPFTRFFDWIVGFVAGYLPGFLSPWLDAFRQYPLGAGLLLLLFSVTFWWGGRLRRTIADRSRFAWHMTKRPSQGVLARRFWDPLANVLLNSRPANGAWHFASNVAAPSALFAVVALAALFLLDRLYFHYRASQGEVCQSSSTIEGLSKETTFDFFVDRPCTATGHRLEKGRYYAATFTIEQDWKDATLPANLGGLKHDELSLDQKIGFFLMGLGIKRVISEPWMKPILQVGPTGFDLIPGEPYFRFVNGSLKNNMTVRFKSPADGELFFYVNDAYTGFIPVAAMLGQENPDGSLRHTYGNNVGKAQIKIEPLPAEFGD